MNAKTDDPLPGNRTTPAEPEMPEIADDAALLFEAVEALDTPEEMEPLEAVSPAPLHPDKPAVAAVKPLPEARTSMPDLAELGDDPVRLYLKDIGSIDLLDTNHEFWLSARMVAVRRLDIIARQHPTTSRRLARIRALCAS